MLCRKLAEINSDIWSVLPLVQALLPGNVCAVYMFSLLLVIEVYKNLND
jgi:hypothetical protein